MKTNFIFSWIVQSIQSQGKTSTIISNKNFVDFIQLSCTELVIKLTNSQNFTVNSHFFHYVMKGKYTVTLINRSYLILPPIQHKVVLLILRTVFAAGFWLLNFLQLKFWARMHLQIGDSSSAVVLYLCVNFHKCVSVAF